MKYKVGDKVRIKSLDWYNENKGLFGELCPDFIVFLPSRSKYCRQIMTVKEVLRNSYNSDLIYYKMIEDDQLNDWTNGMIEGLVEEKPQSKFNIGDVVYSQAYQRNVIIKEIRPYRLYKVGDLLSTWWFITHEDTLCKEIVKSTNEYTLPDGYIFKDENGNVINATKIVLEKKKEYPKTYEECLVITPYDKEERILYLLEKFKQLLIARDAYWKIAGDEMGLGKPWEPNWTTIEGMPAIFRFRYNIVCGSIKDYHCLLVFPTKEMRDAFYENFKELIEICKELL